MGRPREFTAEQVCKACEGSAGILAVVARKLGCDRVTVWRYRRDYPTVRDALEQADEQATDLAEAESVRLIKKGYWPAIQYRLGTKGKKRGYVERQEIGGPDGGKIPLELTIDWDEGAGVTRSLEGESAPGPKGDT